MKLKCRGYCKKCEYSTFLSSDEHCGLIDEQQKVGEWIPVSKRLPAENGSYLCQIDCGIHELIAVLDFDTNLYKVSAYEFYEKKRAGFYDYDSEWGYCEVEDVVAWMPLPELYRKDAE